MLPLRSCTTTTGSGVLSSNWPSATPSCICFNNCCAFSTLTMYIPVRLGSAAFCKYSLLNPLGPLGESILAGAAPDAGWVESIFVPGSINTLFCANKASYRPRQRSPIWAQVMCTNWPPRGLKSVGDSITKGYSLPSSVIVIFCLSTWSTLGNPAIGGCDCAIAPPVAAVTAAAPKPFKNPLRFISTSATAWSISWIFTTVSSPFDALTTTSFPFTETTVPYWVFIPGWISGAPSPSATSFLPYLSTSCLTKKS